MSISTTTLEVMPATWIVIILIATTATTTITLFLINNAYILIYVLSELIFPTAAIMWSLLINLINIIYHLAVH